MELYAGIGCNNIEVNSKSWQYVTEAIYLQQLGRGTIRQMGKMLYWVLTLLTLQGAREDEWERSRNYTINNWTDTSRNGWEDNIYNR